MRASIIIPVYRAEDFISDCLTSILSQTVTDFEVICVDDGSPDGSAEIVEKFILKDPRVRLLRQENAGASSARNAGYMAAQADYVTFVDADDEISADFLEVLLTAAERDDADIAIGNKVKILPGGKKKKKSPILRNGCVDGADHENHRLLPHIAPHAKLLKREFLSLHNIRFYEGVTYEDYIYWLECLTKDPKISQVSDFIYSYKKNPGSISHASLRLNEYNVRSRLVQTEECLRIAREGGPPGLERKIIQAQFKNSVLRHVTPMAMVQERESAREAFEILRQGLEPYRKVLATQIFGWRRLVYKLILDGSLDDLIKVLRFIHRGEALRVELERGPERSRLLVAEEELKSIRSAKTWFRDISDALEMKGR